MAESVQPTVRLPSTTVVLPQPVDQLVGVTLAWNITQGQEAWVVVRPEEESVYFPQACAKSVNSPPEVSCMIEIGAEADYEKQFRLMVVIADDSAQRTLGQYLANTARAGLTDLPAGSQVVESVTVHRKQLKGGGAR
jgi:hypothetical protein